MTESRGAKGEPLRGSMVPELMTRVAGGDERAFADMYDATCRRVFGIVHRVVLDSAQAEEVAQEVYLDVWRGAGRYDSSAGSVQAWLNTIAHRKAVSRVRSVERARRRERRDFEAESTNRVDSDVAEVVVASDRDRRVRAALHTLPESQRVAIELTYFEGRSHREVAAMLGLPLGTVKTRIRDGLRRLRHAFLEYEN